MAKNLDELTDALMRAVGSSPHAAKRVTTVLQRVGLPGMAGMFSAPERALTAATLYMALQLLEDEHPAEFSDLLAVAAKYDPTPEAPEPVGPTPEPDGHALDPPGPTPAVRADGRRSVAAGRDIGVAFTGDNVSTTYVAGDHIDFRGVTVRDGLVGVQLNHFGTRPAPAEWRPVEQVGPLEFGVRPTRPVSGLPDVPPYVPRDCDEELRTQLSRDSLVLILSEPCAGTSYAAWHGVRSLAGHRLYMPSAGEDLRPLVAALQDEPGRRVVWLDGLSGHLGANGLDLPLLGRLRDLRVVLLGTMRPAEYYGRRTGTSPGDRVVAAARTVELTREWSGAELERLAALDDPRAFPAYMWSGPEGVAAYFAVGHHLFDEWRRLGTQLEHPRGQLLVRAAIDLARCGVKDAVPAELLRKIQEQYRAEERESFEDGIDWATKSGLLVRGDGDGETRTWRAYGALVAEALRSDDLEPVPDGVWWTVLGAKDLEVSINREAVFSAAHAALRPRIEAGDAEAAYNLALRARGDEYLPLLRRAADGGHPAAATYMASFLLSAGNEQEAVPYLEVAAEAGESWAAYQLGRIHHDRAEHWLRAAAEAGDGAAAHDLGDMLVSHSPSEALRWYHRAAVAGRPEAAGSLGVQLSLGRHPGAEVWLRYAADRGDARAACMLAAHLIRQSDSDEAEVERLYRQAAEGGSAPGARNLGIILERRGELDAAMKWYLQAHEAGALGTEGLIGNLLQRQGKPRESEEWLLRAADIAMTRLPDALPLPPGRALPTPADTVEE